MLRRNTPTWAHHNYSASLYRRFGAGVANHQQSKTSLTSSSCGFMLPAVGSSLFQSRRNVQFKRTSDMYNAINNKKEHREQWVTKSTADYAERLKVAKSAGIETKAKPFVTTLLYESESKTNPKSANYEKPNEKIVSAGQKNTDVTSATQEDPRVQQHKEEFEKASYEHWHRIKTFDAARSGRFKSYFAEHGWGFFTFYCLVWLASFAGIYFALKFRYVDYRGAFEYVFCLCFGQIERESFFAEMEDVNPMYFDLAFTFALNELLDLVRLPLAVLWFMAIKHWWTRRPEKTMMRDMSPEKAIEFTVKARDKIRRGMMKGSGSTLSSAAKSPNPEVPRH